MNSQPAPPSRPQQHEDGLRHTTADPPPFSPLESLPFDILLAILSQPNLDFDYTTVLNLKNTNSRFYRSIAPDAICPRDAKAAFYQRVETYHQHRDHLVCFSCWELKEREAFPDSQRKGRRGKGGRDLKRQKERWCWECGPEGGRERLGGMRRGNERVYWCGQCESWSVPLQLLLLCEACFQVMGTAADFELVVGTRGRGGVRFCCGESFVGT
jgi:hypothetical protein